jgi:hypothetical protein
MTSVFPGKNGLHIEVCTAYIRTFPKQNPSKHQTKTIQITAVKSVFSLDNVTFSQFGITHITVIICTLHRGKLIGSPMLYYLIYASTATTLMKTEELIKILNESRVWNNNHQITGMLLYVAGNFLGSVLPHTGRQQQGRFIQILEGDRTEVEGVYSRILKDNRHRDLIVLQEDFTASRHFENWAMGFKNISIEEYSDIKGLFNLDNQFLERPEFQKSHLPIKLLQSFYQMSQRK